MKRKALELTLALALLTSSLFVQLVAEAQPEQSNVETLGPVVFNSYSGSVIILSPKNSTNCVNPIQLNFTVETTSFFGEFYDVGLSLDGGVINRVTNFVNKSTVETNYAWYIMSTTGMGSVMLPALAEGPHSATVYYGFQYQEPSTQRYSVFAYATVDFMVVAPPPTISGLSFPAMLVAAASVASAGIIAVGLVLYFRKSKN